MKVNGLKLDIAIAEAGYRRAEFAKLCEITPQGLRTIVKNNRTKIGRASCRERV